jgi:hypothetical protein
MSNKKELAGWPVKIQVTRWNNWPIEDRKLINQIY